MKNIVEYFREVQRTIENLSEVEGYDEQVLSESRGDLRIRLRFRDYSLLEISEAIHILGNTLSWLSYRYHYQDSIGDLIFRYDNAPHHPEIDTYPEHKHLFDAVISSTRPKIELVLKEVKEYLKRKST